MAGTERTRREDRRFRLLDYLVILSVICGCLAAALFGTEIFPFSHYPMYSQKYEPQELRAYWLSGTGTDRRYFENIPVRAFRHPAHQMMMYESIHMNCLRSESKCSRVMQSLLERYNRTPPPNQDLPRRLASLRLQKAAWSWDEVLEERMRNIENKFTLQPAKLKVLVEVYAK